MTDVTITKTLMQSDIVCLGNTNFGHAGHWFEVVEYPHGKQFDGKVGILVSMDGDLFLVTTDGWPLTHPDFVLRPIKRIKIEYTQ